MCPRAQRSRLPRWLGSALLLLGLTAPSTLGDGRLDALRAEIAGLEARLANLGQAQSNLTQQIERIDLEVRLQEKRLAEAGAAYGLAVERVGAAERRLVGLEAELAAARAALGGRVARLYQLGRQGYWRLLLEPEARRDVLDAVRWVRFLARRDARALARYEETFRQVRAERDQLASQRDEAAGWRERERARRLELAAARSEQARLLALTEQERRNLATQAVALVDEARQLAELVADVSAGEAPLAGTPMQRFRSALPLPVAGTVRVRFGTQLDPRYGTRVPHNGWELLTASGAPVRAIYPGRVLYAAPVANRGTTVIVLHPGKMYSLYAGLARVEVKKGEAVTMGARLGQATDKLYFEIRAEDRPVDPQGWLETKTP
jgi:murein hydrolase activator